MDNPGLTVITSVPDDIELQDAIPRYSFSTTEVVRYSSPEFGGHSLSDCDGILSKDDPFS
jgi:hypothetical protein